MDWSVTLVTGSKNPLPLGMGSVKGIMTHAVILPIQASIMELAKQYQAVSQETLNVTASQSVQRFLLDTRLLYSCHATTFTVLITHVVSTAACGAIGNIVCEGPLRDLCTDELMANCSDWYNDTTADFLETILVGMITLFCVYLLVRSELSAFL